MSLAKDAFDYFAGGDETSKFRSDKKWLRSVFRCETVVKAWPNFINCFNQLKSNSLLIVFAALQVLLNIRVKLGPLFCHKVVVVLLNYAEWPFPLGTHNIVIRA